MYLLQQNTAQQHHEYISRNFVCRIVSILQLFTNGVTKSNV